MTIDTIKMPAQWASYLINGDDSGLNEGERSHVDTYLEAQGVKYVHGLVDASAEFSWSYRDHGGEYEGGELTAYSVELAD